jgi:Domain of unknown function (DUF4419)
LASQFCKSGVSVRWPSEPVEQLKYRIALSYGNGATIILIIQEETQMATNQSTAQRITFAVDPVTIGQELLPTEKSYISIEKLLGTSIESCDTYYADVVEQPGFHSLIAAAHLAYQHHFPLVLSPDVLWLTVAQGLANHVNNHAEEMRSRFVSHEGKKLIQVRRDDFVKGSPENPWPEVWPEFSSAIKKAIGPENHQLILGDFSTTRPTERAASEVVLMDCVQSYFDYEFVTMCGIPEITLEGTVEDWEKIHEKVKQLEKFDLNWWTDDVRQITAEFVRASQGKPNQSFWRAAYKQKNSSGGPYTSGWLLRLLPYLKQREFKLAKEGDYKSGKNTPWQTTLKNPWVGKPLLKEAGPFEGVTDSQLPSAASQVPFVWDYLGKRFNYQFVAGVLTVAQDKESGAIRPRIGWAVRPAPQSN